MNDPEFWVSGFTRQDAVDAVATLKIVFPWEWVRRRYRDVAKKPLEVGMWDGMQADQGFPAYVLARTAIGCICKDPGWNYLISLAEFCRLLKGVPKGSSLLQRIATEPGHIHQANFSGYLLRRGLLAEVEPATGSGNAKHDMAARINDVVFDIEMKALTTSDPARQVRREIEEKCRSFLLLWPGQSCFLFFLSKRRSQLNTSRRLINLTPLLLMFSGKHPASAPWLSDACLWTQMAVQSNGASTNLCLTPERIVELMNLHFGWFSCRTGNGSPIL